MVSGDDVSDYLKILPRDPSKKKTQLDFLNAWEASKRYFLTNYQTSTPLNKAYP